MEIEAIVKVFLGQASPRTSLKSSTSPLPMGTSSSNIGGLGGGFFQLFETHLLNHTGDVALRWRPFRYRK